MLVKVIPFHLAVFPKSVGIIKAQDAGFVLVHEVQGIFDSMGHLGLRGNQFYLEGDKQMGRKYKGFAVEIKQSL